MLAILRIQMETRRKFESCSTDVKQGRFQRFWSNWQKKQTFHPVNLSLSRVNKKLFQGGLQRFYVDKRTTATLQEDSPRKMVRILHYNTRIKTHSNLNTTWYCLVFVWKEKISTIFTTNSIDLTWYLIGYLFMQMMVETWSGNSIKRWRQWQMASHWPWTFLVNNWACLKLKIFAENKLYRIFLF